MKKLLILITTIACLIIFFIATGIPMTGVLKELVFWVALFIAGSIICTLLLFGGFFAAILFIITLPMCGAYFIYWIVGSTFHWWSELIYWSSFILVLCLSGYLFHWLFASAGIF